MNKNLLKEIAKRFFIGNPVKIGQRIEGQRLTEGNSYLLGCYAGPDQNEEYLFHEMSHLAEREVNKILERPAFAWGFSFGTYWEVFGQCGWEPQTEQSVLREARVWSYQLSLMREFQLNIDAKELVSSATYLPAFCYFRKRSSKSGYKEKEEEALQILADLVENETAIYTFKKFEENWNLRMNLLKNENRL